MNYVRTHRFDDPQDTLPRPLVQPMTIAQAERAYRSPLFMGIYIHDSLLDY